MPMRNLEISLIVCCVCSRRGLGGHRCPRAAFTVPCARKRVRHPWP